MAARPGAVDNAKMVSSVGLERPFWMAGVAPVDGGINTFVDLMGKFDEFEIDFRSKNNEFLMATGVVVLVGREVRGIRRRLP
jgi:hypothetical protein